MAWASASFAFLADVAMAGLGGNLKRKEAVTGRFADIFSWLYLGTAILRRFEADGRPHEDLPFLRWSMDNAFARMQEAFEGLFANLEIAGASWWLRGPLLLWWRLNPIGSAPADRTGSLVARALQTPGAQRDRLFSGVHLPSDPDQQMHRLERAFELCSSAESIARRIKEAVKAGRIEKGNAVELLARAQEAGVVTSEEARLMGEAEQARNDALAVDSFTLEQYLTGVEAAPQPSMAKTS